MILHQLFCFLAELACNVPDNSKDPACEHYHTHSVFKASMLAWDDLKPMQTSGAEKCGFTDNAAWSEPLRCRKCWRDLHDREKQAVLGLGTDIHCWDLAAPKFNSKNGIEPCEESKEIKRTGRHCVESFGVWNTSYVTWMYLTPHQLQSATTCGYDIASWDGPVDCVTCFEDLSLAKKKQLEQTGTDHARCWDNLLKSYGMDCQQLMQDLPKYHHRKAIYANFQRQYSLRQSLQAALSLPSDSISTGTFNTVSLFLLALCFAVCALPQLRRNPSSSEGPASSAPRYALVTSEEECDEYGYVE